MHFKSVVLVAKTFEGEPRILDPQKCQELFWCPLSQVPKPHFDASKLALQSYLKGDFYPTQN